MNKDEIKQAMLKTMDDMNNRRFSKHTPGPWVASEAKWADGSWGAREGESKLIAELFRIAKGVMGGKPK